MKSEVVRNAVTISLCLCGFVAGKIADIPELKYLNPNVDPCDDFYEFACGNFENYNPIPEDELSWNHFAILQKEIHDLIRVILRTEVDESEPTALKKAKTAYKTCVDTDYTDHLTLTEANLIQQLGGWPAILPENYYSTDFTWADIGDLIADFGIPMFFMYSVIPNLFNASENVIFFTQDTLSTSLITPNIDKDPTIIPVIEKRGPYDFPSLRSTSLERSGPDNSFEEFITKLALRLRNHINTGKRDDDVKNELSKVLDFMEVLLKGGIPSDVTLNPLSSVATISALQNWTDTYFERKVLQLDWLDYFSHVFKQTGVDITPNTKILHTGFALLYGVLNLLVQTDLKVLKNFVLIRILTYSASDSDYFMREAFQTFFRAENFDVYPREEYCLRKVLDYPNDIGMSLALAYEYQLYHFNINNLNGAAEMIEHLEVVFQHIIYDSDWIDEGTKEKALSKAANMITLLAYPDFVEDAEEVDRHYENLQICAWDHAGNSQRMRAFRLANNLAEIGNLRDRRVWTTSPLSANAFYNRQNNRMLFPIAMLNPVFYTDNIILDYGRIGAVIGHEITHGFDSSGMTYDKDGTIARWWSDETEASFKERAACFVQQYSQYLIEEVGIYVNGSLSLDENLADNGGLRIAYRTMKILEKLRKLENKTSYTNDQLFFIAYGTMWCTADTNEYLASLNSAGYAPAKFRVTGAVSNMEEFAEAFSCPVGSKMNPEKRCRLW